MKKLIFRLATLTLCLLATVSDSYAWIIYSRTTTNGGPNGYMFVTDFQVYVPYAWDIVRIIDCREPGSRICPYLTDRPTQGDPVQSGIQDFLLEFVQEELKQGKLRGSETRVFLDPNTGKKYSYTIVWDHQNPDDGSITINKEELI
ncbi:MAG: hypothetical protein KJS92_01140 [Bacteroidetes bacterium]|nr:hypothetical protein [Bacteroidota bacterium]